MRRAGMDGEVALAAVSSQRVSMTLTITLPDEAVCTDLSPEEARVDLACSMFARGALSKLSASAVAGLDFFRFQQALAERHISSYTEEMLNEDMGHLAALKVA